MNKYRKSTYPKTVHQRRSRAKPSTPGKLGGILEDQKRMSKETSETGPRSDYLENIIRLTLNIFF